MAIFQGYVSRSLVAPSRSSPILNSEYLDFFRSYAVGPWFSSCPHWPAWQGSPSGPPEDFAPSLRSLGAASPVSSPFPGPFSLGGTSAICTHSGRLSTCSPPPQALWGTVNRKRRVPPTAILCSGFGIFTFGGARAPRRRVRRGGARLARPSTRSPGPCRRHSGPPASCACAGESPSLSPVLRGPC